MEVHNANIQFTPGINSKQVKASNMKTVKMLQYDLPHMDQFAFSWVTLITAANDIFESFHDALNSLLSQRYMPLSLSKFQSRTSDSIRGYVRPSVGQSVRRGDRV